MFIAEGTPPGLLDPKHFTNLSSANPTGLFFNPSRVGSRYRPQIFLRWAEVVSCWINVLLRPTLGSARLHCHWAALQALCIITPGSVVPCFRSFGESCFLSTACSLLSDCILSSSPSSSLRIPAEGLWDGGCCAGHWGAGLAWAPAVPGRRALGPLKEMGQKVNLMKPPKINFQSHLLAGGGEEPRDHPACSRRPGWRDEGGTGVGGCVCHLVYGNYSPSRISTPLFHQSFLLSPL